MAFTAINKPSVHFDCPIWDGSNSTTTVTGMGFKPDMLWMQRYDGAGHPVINNSTGGTAKSYICSGANAVDTTVMVASYTADGFTLTGNIANTNDASQKHVAACWKANGGTTTSNSDGSITSTVQADTTSGVSIIQWTGTGANGTIGHGLGAAPKYIIAKALGTAADGRALNMGKTVSTAADPETDAAVFCDEQAFSDDATCWNDTAPTSTVFSLGSNANTNASGQECIAYCFAEVQGFSKIGFYEGNGNATRSTFVYCGFKPKWLLFKNRQATEDWAIKVSGLEGYGLGGERTRTLKQANPNNSTNCTVTFTAFGFRVTTTDGKANSENVEYSYLAFAERPMVGSNGIISLAT